MHVPAILAAAALSCASLAAAGPGCCGESCAMGCCGEKADTASAVVVSNAGPAEQDIAKLTPKTGLPVGWTAPDATVTTAEGKATTLHALAKEAGTPVVLVFYRGGWCPYCNKHLQELQSRLSEITEAGGTVIALSPESADAAAKTKEKDGVSYTIVSDTKLEAATRYNLVFSLDDKTKKTYQGYGIDLAKTNATPEWKLPVPAVFVIGTDGVIAFAHADEDYRTRLDAEAIVEAVKAASAG
jgi:peroxiredoxin